MTAAIHSMSNGSNPEFTVVDDAALNLVSEMPESYETRLRGGSQGDGWKSVLCPRKFARFLNGFAI